MNITKIRYSMARPVFQFLANLHWHRKGYGVNLRFLIRYAGIDENSLSDSVKSKLDKKVVALAKVGGGYILRNSLVFPVLDYNEEDLLEPFKYGALAVVATKVIPGYPTIVVDNPMFVYARMANYFRELSKAPVTAVVGSIGKTTTKMMLGSVYKQSAKTSCENGNFTNITHILQLCQHFSPKYRQLICEISEANYGTIEAASIALRPKVAVITAIDLSHMEEYGDPEEIKRQVCSISKNLADDGVVIVNKDEFTSWNYLNERKVLTVSTKGDANYVAHNIIVDTEGIEFEIIDNIQKKSHPIRLKNVWGIHNVGIALQAFAAGAFLGMTDKSIIKGLGKYHTQGIRQNAYWTLNGNLVYADCYNAVAKSISSAMSAAESIPLKNGKKLAVIADVEEAGVVSEETHLQIVDIINHSKFDTVIVYGPKLNKALDTYYDEIRTHIIRCDSFGKVMRALNQNVKKGDLVLFKSSHSWHLDKCIKKKWPVSFYWKLLQEKLPYLLWRISIEFN